MENLPLNYFGKVIAAAEMGETECGEDRLVLTFEDGTKITIWDAGRSCCEARFMTCDDDLDHLVGRTFTNIMVKDGPGYSVDYGFRETAFLEVWTDYGFVTLTTHNEHNGYYGGFNLIWEPLEPHVPG